MPKALWVSGQNSGIGTYQHTKERERVSEEIIFPCSEYNLQQSFFYGRNIGKSITRKPEEYISGKEMKNLYKRKWQMKNNAEIEYGK